MYTLYFDGACEPYNPGGIATWGVVLYEDKNIIYKNCGLACEPFSLKASNNLAEYTALIKGSDQCLNRGIETLTIRGDSQLVIRQMTGEYRVGSTNIIPLYEEAYRLVNSFKKVSFEWVERERNSVADELSKQAYYNSVNSYLPVGQTGVAQARMPFGKYKGKGIEWLTTNKPHYVDWLIEQDWLRKELKEFLEGVRSVRRT